jgi:type I restriction enzyme S subunit
VNDAWPRVSLGEILMEARERVAVDADTRYPIAGVYGFGRGILLRDAVLGAEISAAHLYRIAANQIIYSRLKAFEGAFAIVPEEGDGRFVSNEFPTFDVLTSRALPDFVALALAVPSTWAELAHSITGVGARRERLQVADFLEYELDLPPLDEQRAIVSAVAVARGAEVAAERAFRMAERVARAAAEHLIVEPAFDTVTVEEVITGLRTGESPRCEARPPAPGEWGVLKLSAIRPGRFDGSEAKALPAGPSVLDSPSALHGGEVVMTRSNTLARVGAACRVPQDLSDKLLYPDLVYRLDVDDAAILPDYLVYTLGVSTTREQLELLATGTSDSMKKISTTVIKGLEIPLPSLEVQARTVELLQAYANVERYADGERMRLGDVRAALTAELVSGEVHVQS